MNIATSAHVKVLDSFRTQDTRAQGDSRMEELLAYTKESSMYPEAKWKSSCKHWLWVELYVMITAILDSVELHPRSSCTSLTLDSNILCEPQQVAHRKSAVILQHQVCIRPCQLDASLPLQIITADHSSHGRRTLSRLLTSAVWM